MGNQEMAREEVKAVKKKEMAKRIIILEKQMREMEGKQRRAVRTIIELAKIIDIDVKDFLFVEDR